MVFVDCTCNQYVVFEMEVSSITQTRFLLVFHPALKLPIACGINRYVKQLTE